ncbi:hypothetical protein ES707_08807 [subsurface metagenome]
MTVQGTVYAALALLVLIAVLSGCVGVPDLEATEQFDRTVTVEPGDEVIVINRNGGVNVSVRDEECGHRTARSPPASPPSGGT